MIRMIMIIIAMMRRIITTTMMIMTTMIIRYSKYKLVSSSKTPRRCGSLFEQAVLVAAPVWQTEDRLDQSLHGSEQGLGPYSFKSTGSTVSCLA